jgi:putative ABC transport system substrate-binding protein
VRRRDFMMLLGAAVAWPFGTRAQAPPRNVRRIGIIDYSAVWEPFRQQLHDLGYSEGRNIVIERRFAEGKPDRLAEIARELVRLPVDVIATFGTPQTHAAKQATATIPIVMISIGDPVRVRCQPRPAGREYYRQRDPWPGHRRQTVAAPEGDCPRRLAHGLPVESG